MLFVVGAALLAVFVIGFAGNITGRAAQGSSNVTVIYPNGGETVSGAISVQMTISDTPPYSNVKNSTQRFIQSDGSFSPYVQMSGAGWVAGIFFDTKVLPDGKYKVYAAATFRNGQSFMDTSDDWFTINNAGGGQVTCTDSDGGLNYQLKGNISGKNASGQSYSYADSCIGNSVVEYACKQSNYNVTIVSCFMETCINGACVLAPQVCTPGAKQCEGMYVKTCNAAGTGWGEARYCQYGCENGACKLQAVPGSCTTSADCPNYPCIAGRDTECRCNTDTKQCVGAAYKERQSRDACTDHTSCGAPNQCSYDKYPSYCSAPASVPTTYCDYKWWPGNGQKIVINGVKYQCPRQAQYCKADQKQCCKWSFWTQQYSGCVNPPGYTGR